MSQGAYCDSRVGVVANPRWWRGTSMRCAETMCNSKGCNPHKCQDLFEASAVGEGEDGGVVRGRAMLYRCILPNVCEQSQTPEYLVGRRVDDERFVDNGCRYGHAGPLCGICLDGWAPSLGRCIECESTGFTIIPAVIIAAVVLLLSLGYYTVCWSPLMEDPDKPANRYIEWVKKYEWDKLRDAMKGRHVLGYAELVPDIAYNAICRSDDRY